MNIINLSETDLEKLVEVLLDAFTGYFVKMPEDVGYWERRFFNARVDMALSYGVESAGDLVGFIINAIDEAEGKKTAYNTGTGVVASARGQQLVDQMYDKSIPLLKSQGITQCMLEVVDENTRAIKVYERIGFVKKRRLKSYKGVIQSGPAVRVRLLPLSKLDDLNTYQKYSWDFTNKTIFKAENQYKLYEVLAEKSNHSIGYFVINTQNGTVAQLESSVQDWESLFSGIAWASETIKINNVDSNRNGLIDYLNLIKLPNIIDQFEMSMPI